jgi:hypothetical protein
MGRSGRIIHPIKGTCMSMSKLEAVTEMVKAIVAEGGNSTASNDRLIINDEYRTKLLAGIDDLYKKLSELSEKYGG